MRFTLTPTLMFAAALATCPIFASRADAQIPEPSQAAQPTTGWIDVGVRGTGLNGDGARYERYRDLGDGLFLEGFRLDHVQNGWFLTLGSDHAGRKDQRFAGAATRPGRFDLWFLWDQIPMLMSNSTRSLFDADGSPDVLTIRDDFQSAVQTTPAALAAIFTGNATRFETSSRRHIAEGGVRFLATRDLTLKATVRRTNREGVIPYGGSFGHSSLVEVPAPVNHALTDIEVGGEFKRGRLLARTGYTASLFHNESTTLEFDSPFRVLDIMGTPSRGRLSLSPSSSYMGVNGLVTVQLPGRSRATAYASIGSLTDDGDPIMPQTINSANLALIAPLERTTVDGEARTSAINLTFSTRPVRWADASLRFRSYDYDNRTPELSLTQRVAYDNAPSALPTPVHTEPFGIVRHDFDAEFRVTPLRRAAAAVGFARLAEERNHRLFESTEENIVRVTFDSVGHEYFTVRTKFEHGTRRGEGLDLSVLQAVGEQTGMRHFDVASRDRDRVTVIASVTPLSWAAINASLAAGKDDYVESVFGLRDNSHRVFTVGVDAAPADGVSFAPSYSFERYRALSRSRQANPGPQFDDPSRNWAADSTDRVHSFVLAGSLTGPAERVSVDVSYDFNRARAIHTYIAGAVADRTLPEEVVVESTLPPPSQLPPTRSQLHRGTADVLYALTDRLSFGLSYWYEDYQVEDFTLDADANPDLVRGQVLLIGYLYRPYTANTLWGRLVYRW